MDVLRDGLLFLHFLGFAALFGGSLVQIRDRVQVVNSAMLHGALTQVVTGILLVGVIEGLNEDIDRTKVGVKFGVGLLVALLCWVNRRKEAVPSGLFTAIMVLTLGNVGVAVFWG